MGTNTCIYIYIYIIIFIVIIIFYFVYLYIYNWIWFTCADVINKNRSFTKLTQSERIRTIRNEIIPRMDRMDPIRCALHTVLPVLSAQWKRKFSKPDFLSTVGNGRWGAGTQCQCRSGWTLVKGMWRRVYFVWNLLCMKLEDIRATN